MQGQALNVNDENFRARLNTEQRESLELRARARRVRQEQRREERERIERAKINQNMLLCFQTIYLSTLNWIIRRSGLEQWKEFEELACSFVDKVQNVFTAGWIILLVRCCKITALY